MPIKIIEANDVTVTQEQYDKLKAEYDARQAQSFEDFIAEKTAQKPTDRCSVNNFKDITGVITRNPRPEGWPEIDRARWQ